jgi:hypothetical protein
MSKTIMEEWVTFITLVNNMSVNLNKFIEKIEEIDDVTNCWNACLNSLQIIYNQITEQKTFMEKREAYEESKANQNNQLTNKPKEKHLPPSPDGYLRISAFCKKYPFISKNAINHQIYTEPLMNSIWCYSSGIRHLNEKKAIDYFSHHPRYADKAREVFSKNSMSNK